VAYQQLHRQERQEGQVQTIQPIDVTFEVEETEFDPTRRGFTKIPNYFAHYWTPIIGKNAAIVYERICSFAYGDKEEAHPSIALLADVSDMDRHALTGRKRTDHRPGHKGIYYQKGAIQVLVEHGLIRLNIKQTKSGPHYKFQVQKYPSLLTDKQFSQLSTRLQRMHADALARCERARTQSARPVRVASLPQRGCDAATGGGVTPPQGGCDAATPNKTNAIRQKKQLSPTAVAEADQVREFYNKIGQQRVSQQKVDAGVQTIANLKGQGFSFVEIVFAMTWITSHLELFGGKVHSLALLPKVIGQAMQERESVQKREEKKQHQVREDQQQDREIQRQQELEQRYQALPASEQELLRNVAIERLLQSGFKKQFLLEPLIQGEVYRLLAKATEQEGSPLDRDVHSSEERNP
jgi:hypothetical protein